MHINSGNKDIINKPRSGRPVYAATTESKSRERLTKQMVEVCCEPRQLHQKVLDRMTPNFAVKLVIC